MVKIINQFEIDNKTKGGVDKSGRIYLRCGECNKDMIFTGFSKSKNKGLLNVYTCPACKKIKKVERHWGKA